MKILILIILWVLLIGLLLLAPFGVIFALNTLFTLGIPYNIWTYISVCILNLTWMRKGSINMKLPNTKGE